MQGFTKYTIEQLPASIAEMHKEVIEKWKKTRVLFSDELSLAVKDGSQMFHFMDTKGRVFKSYDKAELFTLCSLQADKVKNIDFTVCTIPHLPEDEDFFKYVCLYASGTFSLLPELPSSFREDAFILPLGEFILGSLHPFSVTEWDMIDNLGYIQYNVVLIKPIDKFHTGEIVDMSISLDNKQAHICSYSDDGNIDREFSFKFKLAEV